MGFCPDAPDTEVPNKQVVIAGIKCYVFGLEQLTAKKVDQVNVAFFLHGRTQSAQALLPAIWHLKQMGTFENGDIPTLLVTIDHRNHGERTVDGKRNDGWTEDNELHCQDMLSMQNGTAVDVSSIISYFEPVVFPNDECSVKKWICMGASLGGHATWIAGYKDPRITHLVPIIGSPSMYTLLEHRAANSKPPIKFGAPLIPESIKRSMKASDPASGDISAFEGKHILVLSGAKDKLVNYVDGGSEAFVARLSEKGVDVEALNEPKIGHQISKEMLVRIAAFLRKAGTVEHTSSRL